MVAIGVFCTFALFVGIGWAIGLLNKRDRKDEALGLYNGVKPQAG